MVIDSLTHLTPDGRWFSTAFDASEHRLLEEMDGAKVDKCVVVALAGFIGNDFVGGVLCEASGPTDPRSFDPSARLSDSGRRRE